MRLVTGLCFILCLSSAAVMAAEAASDERIAALVQDLGAEEYPVRMRAVEALFAIGEPARKALEEAAKSKDPEVRHLADSLLADVSRGIKASWSAEQIKLARGYDQATEEKRLETIRQLTAELGPESVPFLLSCLAADRPHEAESALGYLEKLGDETTWRRIIDDQKKPDGPYRVRALALASLRVGTLDQLAEVLSMTGLDDSTRRRVIEESVKRLSARVREREATDVIESASRLAKAAPNEARFLYLQALGEAFSGRPEAAQELADKAVALNPESEAPHYSAARMLQELGQPGPAMREWEKILQIPPKGDVYDMNAHLGLAAILAERGQYAQAADHYEEMLGSYRRARQSGSGTGMVGADEKQIEQKIAMLRKRAQMDGGVGPLQISLSVEIAGDKLDEMRRALAQVDGSFSMNVLPRGFRLFEVEQSALKYDPAKKEFVLLLNNSPCSDPIPFPAKKEKIRIAVTSLDYCYIFEADTVTGETKKIASFEKNYRLVLKPDARLAEWKDVTVMIGDKAYDWEELKKGVSLDYLPERFDFKIEGTDPTGEKKRMNFGAEAAEPGIGPLQEPAAKK